LEIDVKKISCLIAAFGCLWTVGAAAQIQIPDSVRKSKPLADLRVCMNTMLENAKKANLEAERAGSETFVLHPTREPLVPLAAEATKCLSEAFPKIETRNQKGSNLPHRVWSAEVDGFVIFCAMPAGPNTKDNISPLGGNGPKRAWQGIYFNCKIGKEISI
jgi:hypothetical protein